MSFRKSKRPPRIVITGGPCSGKTTLFKDVLDRYPQVLGIPELASILLINIGVLRSDDPLIYRGPLWEMQRIVESSFHRMAHVLNDVRALVFDSGSVDNAAFLPGGIDELEERFDTSREEEYGRYDHVIWLFPPPKSAFERVYQDNPARIEKYEQARDIGFLCQEAWSEHPNFHEVFYDTDDWEAKSHLAWEILEPILRRAAESKRRIT